MECVRRGLSFGRWGRWQAIQKVALMQARLMSRHFLDRDAAYKFVENAFRDGGVQVTGTAISKVLPPVSRFSPTGKRSKKRESVLSKLSQFFARFFDISSGAL